MIAELHQQTEWMPSAISPGGGWGVPYHEDDLPHPSIEDYVAFVARKMVELATVHQLPLPRLQVEPGRSLVARGGVAWIQWARKVNCQSALADDRRRHGDISSVTLWGA